MHPEIEDAMRPDPSDMVDIPSADPAWDALSDAVTDGLYDAEIDDGPEPTPNLDYEPDPEGIESALREN